MLFHILQRVFGFNAEPDLTENPQRAFDQPITETTLLQQFTKDVTLLGWMLGVGCVLTLVSSASDDASEPLLDLPLTSFMGIAFADAASTATPEGRNFLITSLNEPRYSDFAVDADRMVVVWQERYNAIYAQFLNLSGNAIKPAFIIYGGEKHPRVTKSSNGNFAVTSQTTNVKGSCVHVQLLNVDVGRYGGANQFCNPYDNCTNPSITALGTGLVLTYVRPINGNTTGLVIQLLSADGSPRSIYASISKGTNITQNGVNVAELPQNRFVAAWRSQDLNTGTYSVYAQLFDQSGKNITAAFQVNDASKPAAMPQNTSDVVTVGIASFNCGFLLVWEGADGSIERQLVDFTGEKGRSFSLSVSFSTPNNTGVLTNPNIAALSDNLAVMVWQDPVPPNLYKIVGKLSDSEGNGIGEQFSISTAYTSPMLYVPSVKPLNDHQFAVIWDSPSGIYGQIFNFTSEGTVTCIMSTTSTTNTAIITSTTLASSTTTTVPTTIPTSSIATSAFPSTSTARNTTSSKSFTFSNSAKRTESFSQSVQPTLSSTLTLVRLALSHKAPVISSSIIAALSGMNYAAPIMYGTMARNIIAVGNLAQCMSIVNMGELGQERPELEKLQWDNNPLGITIGESTFDTYRGAIVGNMVVIIGFPLVGLGIAFVCALVKGRPLSELIDKLHVPGLIALPISVLAPATLGAAFTMISYAYNRAITMTSSDIGLVSFAFIYAASAPMGLYTWLGIYFRHHGVLEDSALENKNPETIMEIAAYFFSWLMDPTQEWKKSTMLEKFQMIVEAVSNPFFPAIDLLNALLISLISGLASQCSFQRCCVISNGSCLAISILYLLSHLVWRPCLVRFDKVTLPSLAFLVALVSTFSLIANTIHESQNALDAARLVTEIAFYSTWIVTSIAVAATLFPFVHDSVKILMQQNNNANARQVLESLMDTDVRQELQLIASGEVNHESNHNSRQLEQPILSGRRSAPNHVREFVQPVIPTRREHTHRSQLNPVNTINRNNNDDDSPQFSRPQRYPLPQQNRHHRREDFAKYSNTFFASSEIEKQRKDKTCYKDETLSLSRQQKEYHSKQPESQSHQQQSNVQEVVPPRNNDHNSLAASTLPPFGSMMTRAEVFAHFNRLRDRRQLGSAAPRPLQQFREFVQPVIPPRREHTHRSQLNPVNTINRNNNDHNSLAASTLPPFGSMMTRAEVFAHFNRLRDQRQLGSAALRPLQQLREFVQPVIPPRREHTHRSQLNPVNTINRNNNDDDSPQFSRPQRYPLPQQNRHHRREDFAKYSNSLI